MPCETLGRRPCALTERRVDVVVGVVAVRDGPFFFFSSALASTARRYGGLGVLDRLEPRGWNATI